MKPASDESPTATTLQSHSGCQYCNTWEEKVWVLDIKSGRPVAAEDSRV